MKPNGEGHDGSGLPTQAGPSPAGVRKIISTARITQAYWRNASWQPLQLLPTAATAALMFS